MFEKILLTFTITLSISLFIGFGARSSTQGTLPASSTQASSAQGTIFNSLSNDSPKLAVISEQPFSAHE